MLKESRVSLLNLVSGLSETIDLISPVLVNHHMQVAYIAFSISEELKAEKEQKGDVVLTEELDMEIEQKSELVLAGALHDIGCYCLKERMDLLQFETEVPQKHAELGYLFLNKFEPFSNIATLVRYHHVHWDKIQDEQKLKHRIPLGSFILHLADRIAVSIDKQKEILEQAPCICEKIKNQSGKMFMPKLVDAFLRLATKEYFWLEVVLPSLEIILAGRIKQPTIDLNMKNLVSFAQLFSRIVDFRSRFFATHSSGVAATAEKLAKFGGFSKQESQWMKIAGYLHDIGKLIVPIEILEKSEKLSDKELNIVRKHSFYTNCILKRISAFKNIIEWASFHHEHLTGTGYPFRVKEENIPLGARVLAVANVFSTLTEDRPYRKKYSNEKVQETLQQMANDYLLDPNIVSLLLLHFNEINSTLIAAREKSKDEYHKIEYILSHPD